MRHRTRLIETTLRTTWTAILLGLFILAAQGVNALQKASGAKVLTAEGVRPNKATVTPFKTLSRYPCCLDPHTCRSPQPTSALLLPLSA